MNEYKLFFLSELKRDSRYLKKANNDFNIALEYMFSRIDQVTSETDSQFNVFIDLIRKWIPNYLLLTLLNRMRYDSIVGFKAQGDEKHVYCMISFQKHPSKQMIGMFDMHINPQDRNKNVAHQFETMSYMLNELCVRYKKNGYRYLQCGNNDTTTRALRIFSRIARKKYPQLSVDIETSRIYP